MGAGLGGLVRRLGGPPVESDAALLGRVVDGRCPDAFAALVARHGPAVLGACRRALGDGPDADDAFQAVWLVLLRKAGTVAPRGRVGPWLYGVAVRTARQARSRRRRHGALPDVPDRRPVPDPELAALLDAELLALPAGMRAAVVLCEIEGRSLRAAAGELGVPVGTLASRLARGRQRLADRLRRRGVTVSVGGLSGWLAAEATARVPAGLVASAGGPATPAVDTITKGVLTMLLFDKLRRAAVGLVLAGGLAAVGGAGVSWGSAPVDEPSAKQPAATTNATDPAFDKLWDGLQEYDDDTATRAVLALSRRPAELVARAKTEAKPLTTTADAVRAKLKLLGDKDEGVWKPAFEWLEYYDPRLVIGLEGLMTEVTETPARQRMVVVLSGRKEKWLEDIGEKPVELRPVGDDGYNFFAEGSWWAEHKVERLNTTAWGNAKRKWTRLTRTVALLEHVGTPAAVAVIRDVATGHPDAGPTKTAQAALDRLAKK